MFENADAQKRKDQSAARWDKWLGTKALTVTPASTPRTLGRETETEHTDERCPSTGEIESTDTESTRCGGSGDAAVAGIWSTGSEDAAWTRVECRGQKSTSTPVSTI